MKKSLLLFGCLLFCLSLNSQLAAVRLFEGNSILEQDTVFTEEIKIRGNLLIPRGISLTIKPGVKITFLKSDEPGRLTVRGQLICEGEPDQPISFSSELNLKGSWYGIYLFSEANETDPEKAHRLRSISISLAEQAITLERGILELTDSELTRCKNGLSLMANAKARVNKVTFDSINTQAVTLARGGDLVLTNNTFRYNKIGVKALGGYTLQITDNYFIKNDEALKLTSAPLTTNIWNNLFEKNNYAYRADKRCSGQLAYNRFIENNTAAYISMQSNPHLKHNLFTKNKVAINCNRMSHPLVERNEITQNETAVKSLLGSYPKLRWNNIYDNQTAIFLRFMSSDWLLQSAISVEENTFEASNNWWGEQMTEMLNQQGENFNRPDIFDGYDVPFNQDRGLLFLKQLVNYSKWLSVRSEPTYQAAPQ